MKTTIEIEVKEINVTHDGYYFFAYEITIDGKKGMPKIITGDWSGQSADHFKSVLQNGYAMQLALESIELYKIS